MPGPLRVVFMGTPDFALPSLRALAARPDLVQHTRGLYSARPALLDAAKKLPSRPSRSWPKSWVLPFCSPKTSMTPTKNASWPIYMADVVVVVAYAQFLSSAILNTPRLGCINVHSSLLPKYRGAAPIQYAIWKGEKESGVSTMRLVPKMDAGPVLLQKSIPITEEMTAAELHDELAKLGGEPDRRNPGPAARRQANRDGTRRGRSSPSPAHQKRIWPDSMGTIRVRRFSRRFARSIPGPALLAARPAAR